MKFNFINGWSDKDLKINHTIISFILFGVVLFSIYCNFEENEAVIGVFNFGIQVDF